MHTVGVKNIITNKSSSNKAKRPSVSHLLASISSHQPVKAGPMFALVPAPSLSCSPFLFFTSSDILFLFFTGCITMTIVQLPAARYLPFIRTSRVCSTQRALQDAPPAVFCEAVIFSLFWTTKPRPNDPNLRSAVMADRGPQSE